MTAVRGPSPGSLPRSTIWLARHGEVHNPDRIFYGRLPRMGLSPTGTREAAALADFLAERPLAALYSSPMLRARKTAEAIRLRHPHLRTRIARDLIEIGTGWQGHSADVLDTFEWDYYGNPLHPTDETLESIRDRMMRWLRRTLRRHTGQEVAAVSHGDPILILVSHLRGVPMELSLIRPRPYIATASVFRLGFDQHGTFTGAEMFVPHEQAAA